MLPCIQLDSSAQFTTHSSGLHGLEFAVFGMNPTKPASCHILPYLVLSCPFNQHGTSLCSRLSSFRLQWALLCGLEPCDELLLAASGYQPLLLKEWPKPEQNSCKVSHLCQWDRKPRLSKKQWIGNQGIPPYPTLSCCVWIEKGWDTEFKSIGNVRKRWPQQLQQLQPSKPYFASPGDSRSKQSVFRFLAKLYSCQIVHLGR